MDELIEFCEVTPPVTSLWVGCSLGRGAADALSDIDAALGVAAERGSASSGQVPAAEAMVVAALPGLGALVDVLRHRLGPGDRPIRRIFAQFADGTQLDLAIMAEGEVRRGGARPGLRIARARQICGQPAVMGRREENIACCRRVPQTGRWSAMPASRLRVLRCGAAKRILCGGTV
jgi:hypothetical protein